MIHQVFLFFQKNIQLYAMIIDAALKVSEIDFGYGADQLVENFFEDKDLL